MILDLLKQPWEAQPQDPSGTFSAFDEPVALLVDAEWLARENRRLARALQEARLRRATHGS